MPAAAAPVARPPVQSIAPRSAGDGLVEFADEVVEVRPSRSARPEPVSPGAQVRRQPTGTKPELQQQSRMLQFARTAKPGGRLADDIGQMGAGARWLVYGAVALATVGLVWGVMTLVR